MASHLDDNRSEILIDARAKREAALRAARAGGPGEEQYWLAVAERITAWIEHLERREAVPDMPSRRRAVLSDERATLSPAPRGAPKLPFQA